MFNIPFAARMFLTKWWPAIAAIVVILGILTYVYFHAFSAGKTTEVVKQVEREIEVQREVNDANENASAARVDAERELAEQARELEDAEQDADSLDDVRIKRGCVVLRQQGRDTTKIPACR